MILICRLSLFALFLLSNICYLTYWTKKIKRFCRMRKKKKEIVRGYRCRVYVFTSRVLHLTWQPRNFMRLLALQDDALELRWHCRLSVLTFRDDVWWFSKKLADRASIANSFHIMFYDINDNRPHGILTINNVDWIMNGKNAMELWSLLTFRSDLSRSSKNCTAMHRSMGNSRCICFASIRR